MEVKTFSHFFSKNFMEIWPPSEHVEFSDGKYQIKNSQFALPSWADTVVLLLTD